MKYIITLVTIVAAVAVVFFLFKGNTIDYAATVNDEVVALEAELQSIEAALQVGTMTPEEAVEAQNKIVTRLGSINTAVEASGKAKLTDAQKQMLSKALTNLYDNLNKYRSTLVTVETAAEAELTSGTTPRNRRGGSVTISATLAKTQDIVSEVVSVEVAEEISDDISDVIDDINDDIAEEITNDDETTEEDLEENLDDEESSPATPEDETVPEDGEEDSSSEETGAEDETDVDIEVNTSTEGEIEVTQ